MTAIYEPDAGIVGELGLAIKLSAQKALDCGQTIDPRELLDEIDRFQTLRAQQGEVVGWAWEGRVINANDAWVKRLTDWKPKNDGDARKIRPLYTHPAQGDRRKSQLGDEE